MLTNTRTEMPFVAAPEANPATKWMRSVFDQIEGVKDKLVVTRGVPGEGDNSPSINTVLSSLGKVANWEQGGSLYVGKDESGKKIWEGEVEVTQGDSVTMGVALNLSQRSETGEPIRDVNCLLLEEHGRLVNLQLVSNSKIVSDKEEVVYEYKQGASGGI